MSSWQPLSFSTAVVVASILTALCSRAPREAERTWGRDRLGIWATPKVSFIRRLVTVAVGACHAVVASSSSETDLVCRHPQNINRKLFEWNKYTTLCLFLIVGIGAPLRLLAFAQLGGNFTFQLARPSGLTTTGVYRYIQHPGYTGQVLVLLANLAYLFRWDGVVGCWVSQELEARLNGWGLVCYGVMVLVMARKVLVRVMDEEEMLRKTFGDEWVLWHTRTMRFIPGVM
ncbi:isoprenylcysteine carboxyl methyltransferase [Colletotrichum graminicola]|uniref:Protein-S-isoprenylcysteine O-methyltransferase n=1 Tax=Colletotrichum graminicola (strain M1.001 / M2 / FGSC 10212) TaxID=645133 RepID=E3Q2C8_COLGM|nr:isoprenylcysteine carboxyl methyltransferase [Colletotrichum graminicola M1.001]EFQ25229.1 isoprenylcysteine carboxyl methyltransferase [Colletotrichum graminicola M1.001]WDK15145.1 isoprenylcysteine carboxyl methyltransferase [Colletotrichum graminicola]